MIKPFSYEVCQHLGETNLRLYSHAPIGLETVDLFMKEYNLSMPISENVFVAPLNEVILILDKIREQFSKNLSLYTPFN